MDALSTGPRAWLLNSIKAGLGEARRNAERLRRLGAGGEMPVAKEALATLHDEVADVFDRALRSMAGVAEGVHNNPKGPCALFVPPINGWVYCDRQGCGFHERRHSGMRLENGIWCDQKCITGAGCPPGESTCVRKLGHAEPCACLEHLRAPAAAPAVVPAETLEPAECDECENDYSFECEVCKEVFCLRHATEHRCEADPATSPTPAQPGPCKEKP